MNPSCIVGELASYLRVNREFPNIGPFVSVFDQQSNLLSRLDAKRGPGLEPGQFLSPHSIAYDSTGDLYVGDVVDADWSQVLGDCEKPDTSQDGFRNSSGSRRGTALAN